MTCEIAILTRSAVALAADSAATVTRWTGKSAEERYYKGANKIFQLSSIEPVGLMIYGSADLHDVPWEVIVKESRSHLGDGHFDTLNEYAKNFVQWISNNYKIFPAAVRTKLILNNASIAFWIAAYPPTNSDEFKNAATNEAKAAILNPVLDRERARLEALNCPFGLDQEYIDNLVTTNLEAVKAHLAQDHATFADICDLDIAARMALLFIAKEATMFGESGIVIAGFGREDIFPSLVEIKVRGLVGERLLVQTDPIIEISSETPQEMKAFATTRMVDTFVRGFSPDVYQNVCASYRRSLTKKLAECGKNCEDQEVKVEIENELQEFTKDWAFKAFDAHYNPMKQVIASLPVGEMASLAEALINVEAIKEKVTLPSESVGGPIDVAVISKGDGFVWIKRKHYFDPSINARYFQRLKMA
jgi:hypothetical protein